MTLTRNVQRRFRNAARKGRKLGTLLTQPRWRRGLLSSVAATVEHDALPIRRDLRTVFDVGANRGQFCLYSLARFPSATILAFEPIPDAVAHLEALYAHEDRVEVMPFALGNTEGDVDMHLSAREDSSSLLPVGKRQISLFPGTAEVGTVRAQVKRLDSVLDTRTVEAPALLKIDVQGFELPVLRGAERSLRLFDQVLIEASFTELYDGQALFPEVTHFIEQHGFHLVSGRISASDATGRWLQGDFLFERG